MVCPMDFKSYSQRQQFYVGEIPAMLERRLASTNWNTVLELGCGDGSLISALESQGTFTDKSVIAYDLSSDRVEVVQTTTKNIDCVVGDACSLAIQDQSVDFIITSQVIEHVDDDNLMAQEMYRVLAGNGLAYISTVFKKWYGWYFYRCNGKWTLDPTHLREYNEESQLIDKLENCGFTVIENKKYLDGRPIVDSVLRRFGADRQIYSNGLLRSLRLFRVPLPGYYIWELVCAK